MTLNKIELVTQPEKHSPDSARDSTLHKLQNLVEEEQKANPEADSVAHDAASASTKDPLSGKDFSHELLLLSTKYDEDGFEIPSGKIPIDGHFSTDEVKELVSLAKQEGILQEQVSVEVMESSDLLGDKIQVVERDTPEKEDLEEKKGLDTKEKELDTKAERSDKTAEQDR